MPQLNNQPMTESIVETETQPGRRGNPIRAKPVALKTLRNKILGQGLNDLHADIYSLQQKQMQELHSCIDSWAKREELVSPTASQGVTPWTSRSPSPAASRCVSASTRRRDPYPGIPSDSSPVKIPHEKPELLEPETKLQQFPDGFQDSWAESRQAKTPQNFRESNDFPPVPGAIDSADEQDAKIPAGFDVKRAPPAKKSPGMMMPMRQKTPGTASKDSGDTSDDGDQRRAQRKRARSQNRGIFVNIDDLKETLRENLTKPEADKQNFYYDSGAFQFIAKHRYMESITLTVILINAVWMGYDADQNNEANLLDADLQFLIAENFFTCFFLFEWIVRFGAFELKRNCFCDAWFVFDSMLLLMMITETWVFTFLFGMSPGLTKAFGALRWFRLLRLTRLARIARLLRAVPQLMIMCKAIVISIKTVSYAFVLLILMVYVFGVAFTIMLDGSDDRFDGVLIAMNTLLLFGALPDQVDLINELRLQNIGFYFLILLYLIISSLTLMNMLIGIITEVISAVSTLEKEEMLLQDVKEDLWSMLKGMNFVQDYDDTISKFEFQGLLAAPKAAQVLEDVGVDAVGLVDFADYIFSDDRPTLTFGDFMDIVLQLRGSNTASVKDIIDLRKIVLSQVRALEDVSLRVQTRNNTAAGVNTPASANRQPTMFG